MRLAAVAFLLSALSAQGADLAPVSGIYGATLGAGAATAAERSAFGQNPAAVRPGTFAIRCDGHRPFGMADLAVAEAGIARDGRRAGLDVDWRVTMITELYTEHGFRLAPSLRVLGRPSFPGTLDLGYGLTAWRAAWEGAAPAWDVAQEAGAVWNPWPRLKAGAFAAGLPLRPGVPAPGRVVQVGIEADSRPPDAAGGPEPFGQVLRLDFRRSGDGPWRALASLTARPCPGAEFSLGLADRPFQVAAGLGVAWRGFRVRQAARYHRYLGRTWLSGLAFSAGGGT